jgi:hypothetical protein
MGPPGRGRSAADPQCGGENAQSDSSEALAESSTWTVCHITLSQRYHPFFAKPPRGLRPKHTTSPAFWKARSTRCTISRPTPGQARSKSARVNFPEKHQAPSRRVMCLHCKGASPASHFLSQVLTFFGDYACPRSIISSAQRTTVCASSMACRYSSSDTGSARPGYRASNA